MITYETKQHMISNESEQVEGMSYDVLAIEQGDVIGVVEDFSPDYDVAREFAAQCAERQIRPDYFQEAALWYLSLHAEK